MRLRNLGCQSMLGFQKTITFALPGVKTSHYPLALQSNLPRSSQISEQIPPGDQGPVPIPSPSLAAFRRPCPPRFDTTKKRRGSQLTRSRKKGEGGGEEEEEEQQQHHKLRPGPCWLCQLQSPLPRPLLLPHLAILPHHLWTL